MKALVLAHNESPCRALEEVLRERGHEVTIVEDADSACSAFQTEDHPIVFVDVDTQPIDSRTLCRRIRTLQYGEACLLLALTKRTDASRLSELLDAGFDDYLLDPVADPALLRMRLDVAERRVFASSTCWFSLHRERQHTSARCVLARDVPYGVFRVSADGRFSRVNQALVHILGYDSEAELLAANLARDILQEPAALDRFLAEAGTHRPGGELDLRRKDGTPVVVHVSGHRTLDRDGAISGFEGVAHDVTEEKRIENALVASEQRYRSLLEAVTSYTYTVKFERGVPVLTEHSPGCLTATGYGPQEYASNPDLWFAMVHPEDRGLVQKQVAEIRTGKSVSPIEHRIRHKDGTIRWVRSTLVPRRDDRGELVRYDGLIEDITERKEAESELEANILVQKALRRILQISLEAIPLEKMLERTLDVLFSVPFVALESKGAVFLTEEDREVLTLKAQRGLPHELLLLCDKVPFGSCLCGRSAASRQIAFADCIDTRHERSHSDILPHGHFCVPIVSDEQVFGVMNLYVRDGHKKQAMEELFLVSVADLLAGTIKRKRAEQSLRMAETELVAAQRIQQDFLPGVAPELPGLGISGALRPAEYTAGDCFDYITLPDGSLAIVLGDVSGHGFSSALLMTSVQAHLRSLAEMGVGIDDMLAHTNTMLLRETEVGRFVTMILARLDPHSRTLSYVNAGHPSGYVLNRSGAVRAALQSATFPLGIVPDAEFPLSGPVKLEPGDTVVLLTDGILEARSPEDALFGAERTLDTMVASCQESAGDIIDSLFSAVSEFSGSLQPQDDMTVVVIQVEGP
jgi:sigma-B regulation protein RsbU (phosphoserine phosphatase)